METVINMGASSWKLCAHTGFLIRTPKKSLMQLLAWLPAYAERLLLFISLVDVARQWFKSKVGLEAAETPREDAFCAYTILQHEPFVIPDTQSDQRFSETPLVTSDPNMRFYCGLPLTSEKGLGLGSLCVIDTKPRQLTAEQMEGLEVLSQAVVTKLQLRRTLNLLNEYRRC